MILRQFASGSNADTGHLTRPTSCRLGEENGREWPQKGDFNGQKSLSNVSVVLFQPQIPQNTGNIVRTCACTGASLILVPPLGFSITDRWLKRAGLDYWEGVDVRKENHFEEYLENLQTPFYFFSSKASTPYTKIDFSPEDHIIFGSETKGLPSSLHDRWNDRFYKIPMKDGARCLNLSNSVSIVLYEAWRQLKYDRNF